MLPQKYGPNIKCLLDKEFVGQAGRGGYGHCLWSIVHTLDGRLGA